MAVAFRFNGKGEKEQHNIKKLSYVGSYWKAWTKSAFNEIISFFSFFGFYFLSAVWLD